MAQPLAEVFGFPISNESDKAISYRSGRLCPFHNTSPNCTKNSVENPLGVCSMFHSDKEPVIICPVRFREDWLILNVAAEYFFPKDAKWTSLGEVRLDDAEGNSVGNVDYILVSYDNYGRIIDFASLEVQAVYISGNITGPFNSFTDDPSPDFEWSRAVTLPRPDYLSSSKKRLVPQLIAKGKIFNEWGKKQGVVLQNAFYKTLTSFPISKRDESDLAWFIYYLERNEQVDQFVLRHEQTVFSKYIDCMQALVDIKAGRMSDFQQILQDKLRKKLKQTKPT